MKPLSSSAVFPDAHWLWHASPQRDERDRRIQFRRTFELHDIPASAEIRITTDSFYTLWINGKYVNRGPARGFQRHWPFDRLETAPYLQKGKNTLSWKIRKLTAPLQLSLLRIQIRSKQTELRLHTLEVWERKVPEACVQVEVETGHPLHLILPEGEQKAVIRLENQTRAPLRLQGEFEICDYFGRVDSFSHFLSFTPRQVQTISLPVGRYPRNGIFFVRSTFRDPESGEVYQDQHCFARMVPAGPTPASDFRKAGGRRRDEYGRNTQFAS